MAGLRETGRKKHNCFLETVNIPVPADAKAINAVCTGIDIHLDGEIERVFFAK
jgi:hypothetical protein